MPRATPPAPGGEQPAPSERVFQVAELARRIKFLIEEDVGIAWVEGECSNVKANAASGHVYFNLKDDQAQIQCAFFLRYQRGSPALPRDGARVRVRGLVTAYEKSSQYQIVVHRVEEAGEGALRAAFERLKARLLAEGLFDAARKRPLPRLPARIGLVTSPTGAALRDMLAVLGRRFPDRWVRVMPVRVQGPGAAEEIAEALDLLNAHRAVDVIIVGRGGGSLEDLWAFNEECVARAIRRSIIPVISAVGHETDVTISDFAADVRAATPSAAAELVVEAKEDLEHEVHALAGRMAAALRTRMLEARNRLLHIAHRPVLASPLAMVERPRRRLDMLAQALVRRTATATQHQRVGLERLHGQLVRRLESAGRDAQRRLDDALPRLQRALENAARERERELAEARLRLEPPIRRRLQEARETLGRLEATLTALNPLAVLQRGYSITTGPDGQALTSPASVRAGDRLTTRLAAGTLHSVVDETPPAPGGATNAG